eukprot:m.81212 g.81212  ORF g.81212 m.81212 type:complete len:199 (+) comp14239_c0_seq2:65-661(+)
MSGPELGKEYEVVLGPSFADDSTNALLLLNYDFKPSWAQSTGVVEVTGSNVHVQLEGSKEGAFADMFGALRDNNTYVCRFDAERSCFVIDKVGYQMQVKYQRKSESARVLRTMSMSAPPTQDAVSSTSEPSLDEAPTQAHTPPRITSKRQIPSPHSPGFLTKSPPGPPAKREKRGAGPPLSGSVLHDSETESDSSDED